MKDMKPNRIFLIASLIVMAAIFLAYGPLQKMGKVPSGYVAKVTCSEVFVAGRDSDVVTTTNFANISPTFEWVTINVRPEIKTVKTSFLGISKSEAVYRDNIGCRLNGKGGLDAIDIPAPQNVDGHQYEAAIRSDVQASLAPLFDDENMESPIRTRGLVVIQNNQIIAERYDEGFTAETRQQSWSTAKGVTQALIGIAAHKGYLSLSDNALMPAWQGDDPRAEITLGNLLHMASGLDFGEDYANPNSDVDQMLFNQKDMGMFAAAQELIHPPGTQSIYSSGTTNIASHILRTKLESASVDYHAFPRRALFDRLSMSSAIFEVDGAGNFIGSSYIYATPRDFARFGQLYLQRGIWKGEQILPQGWTDYTAEPAPGSDQKYGSHWSINLGQKTLPGLPEDVIHLGGNDGQMIVVIPSKNAVIVRLGVTRWPATMEADVYPLIRQIYEAL